MSWKLLAATLLLTVVGLTWTENAEARGGRRCGGSSKTAYQAPYESAQASAGSRRYSYEPGSGPSYSYGSSRRSGQTRRSYILPKTDSTKFDARF